MVALVLPIASYENADFDAAALVAADRVRHPPHERVQLRRAGWANRHSSLTTVTAFFPLQIGSAALFQWVFLARRHRNGNVGALLTIRPALMVVARPAAVAAAEVE